MGRNLLFVFVLLVAVAGAPLPVVLWHGMGDDCCNPYSMGAIEKLVKAGTNGTFVHSIRIGDTDAGDRLNSFFMPAEKQIREACTQISIPELANGFNAVGFSQGGQFLRALVQTCPAAKVHNLISVGGQHQGVFGLPQCPPKSWFCTEGDKLADDMVYAPFFQKHLAQANYWHDALDEVRYEEKNVWLPSVNGVPFDAQQKTRLTSLSKFVMVMFQNDTMVVPKESEHFGWYAKNSSATRILPLNETSLYTDAQDVLGLRQMDEAGKLVFLSVEGNHLQFTNKWFQTEIISQYLV